MKLCFCGCFCGCFRANPCLIFDFDLLTTYDLRLTTHVLLTTRYLILMHPFLQKLAERPLLLDGAMGTMLYARGASSEQCLEHLIISRPGWVTEIHQAYASAGADILKSHTFGSNRVRLAEYGLHNKVRELNFKAVRLLRDVREVAGRAIFIAGDIGPLGKRLQPEGDLSHEEAREAFREQVSVLWEAGVDLLLFETFTSLEELEIGVGVAREVCDLPIVASMSFKEDGDTNDGFSPEEVAQRLLAAGVDALGANCSVGPAPMLETVERIHNHIGHGHDHDT